MTAVLLGIACIGCAAGPNTEQTEKNRKETPAKQSSGTAKVYFTRDLSGAGLRKVYQQINQDIKGKVAIKIHTGEKNGPNILPREWVRELQQTIPDSALVETNTYYVGDRDTTARHRETLQVNGWTFCPVDILDEDGAVMLPVKNAFHLQEVSMGKNILNYDSMLVLTHFKGHAMGGFGGSMKNIAIGNADAHVGKRQIHSGNTGSQWGITKEEFMENMADSAKATVDHFGRQIAFINVLRNMSVDCDCAGVSAAPPKIDDIGILASVDILAVDKASVDMVWAADDRESHDLKERIESRAGLRQLSAMKELGLGSDKYELIDLDK